MTGTRGLGATGERLALDYLLSRGYKKVATNWRIGMGEIDLIVMAEDTVVFVEVRTRRGRDLGTPEESITFRKAEKLRSLAQQWIAEHYPDANEPDWRIDFIGVHLTRSGQMLGLHHLESAVEA